MVGLDWQKIGGFWWEVGVASDQSLAHRVEGLFLTLNRSNLTMKVAYNSSGSCEIDRVMIDTTGKFTFPGHREIQVLDTDYKGYAILRVSLMWRGRNFQVLKYFTRSLEDEERLGFWRFWELTADTGLYLAAWPGWYAKLLKEELI
uniref:Lipocalin 8 n=1 Tax=Callithrix jacchus TaxID=9483 RepID=F7H6T8_CALJA